MNKKRIVKREFGYLKEHHFKLKRKKYGKFIHSYLFYNLKDPSIKVIITENLHEKYLGLKIRGHQHKILLSYDKNQLFTNENLENTHKLIQEINISETNDFQKIIKIYSELVQTNLNIILKGC